jgi:hypothetical protein
MERIKAGNPLSKTRPAGEKLAATENFDRFIDCYNHAPPLPAFNMKYPGSELHVSSLRPYKGRFVRMLGFADGDRSP